MQAGHPVVVSTEACGGRLGGGPAHDGAFTDLVRAPEVTGDTPSRHIPRPTSLRALHCVPSGVVVRAWLPEPCPAATGGCGFTIETGSESAIGITQPLSGSFSLALGAMAPLQRPVIEAERESTQILSAPLAAAAKGAPEPTVEIRYQGTGWDRLFAQFGIVN